MGVDLAAIRGTGAGGMITREDVLKASRATPERSRGNGGRRAAFARSSRRGAGGDAKLEGNAAPLCFHEHRYDGRREGAEVIKSEGRAAQL